jgi:hypothetical protein
MRGCRGKTRVEERSRVIWKEREGGRTRGKEKEAGMERARGTQRMFVSVRGGESKKERGSGQ